MFANNWTSLAILNHKFGGGEGGRKYMASSDVSMIAYFLTKKKRSTIILNMKLPIFLPQHNYYSLKMFLFPILSLFIGTNIFSGKIEC